MSSLAVVASVLLGASFLVAGGSKIAAGTQWPEQARAMGAPRAVIPVLPWFELALGGLLIAQVASRAVGAVAFGLLVAFTVLIVRRLRAGQHPPCACFGAWSAQPLGWGHVARNAALMVLAIVTIVA